MSLTAADIAYAADNGRCAGLDPPETVRALVAELRRCREAFRDEASGWRNSEGYAWQCEAERGCAGDPIGMVRLKPHDFHRVTACAAHLGDGVRFT